MTGMKLIYNVTILFPLKCTGLTQSIILTYIEKRMLIHCLHNVYNIHVSKANTFLLLQ